MDRFDEMRVKGINTNDATAIASDILQGKTAYVAGNKVIGTLIPSSGVDLSGIGTSITVQAINTISKGGRFVGQKSENYTPTLKNITPSGTIPDYTSDDMKVGVKDQTISSSSTSVSILFWDEQKNAYFPLNVALPSTISGTNLNCANINSDGDLALFFYAGNNSATQSIVIVEIDKEAKNAEAFILPLGISSAFSKNYLSLIKKYILPYNSSTLKSYWLAYNKETHNIEQYQGNAKCITNPNYSYGPNQCFEKNDNIFLYLASGTLYKTIIDDTSKNVVSASLSNTNFGYSASISTDGTMLIACNSSTPTTSYTCRFYYIDIDNSTLKDTGKTINLVGYPKIDGNKLMYSNGIKDITDLSNIIDLYSGSIADSNNKTNKSLKLNLTKFWTGNTMRSFIDSINAEYLIENTSADNIIENRIYGLASNNLTVGEIGIAQMLFNTYKSE